MKYVKGVVKTNLYFTMKKYGRHRTFLKFFSCRKTIPGDTTTRLAVIDDDLTYTYGKVSGISLLLSCMLHTISPCEKNGGGG